MQVGPPFYPQNQVDVLGNDYFGLLKLRERHHRRHRNGTMRESDMASPLLVACIVAPVLQAPPPGIPHASQRQRQTLRLQLPQPEERRQQRRRNEGTTDPE
jgi:hypothetical protein